VSVSLPPQISANQPLAQLAYDYTQVWASVLKRNGPRAQAENAQLQADAKAYRDSAAAEPNRICSPKLRLLAEAYYALWRLHTLLDPSSRHADEERRYRANWDGAADPDPAHM